MLRTILFGPGSLKPGGKKPNSPRTCGKLWAVTGVTPGAIAFVSVLVSFQFCLVSRAVAQFMP